VRGLIAFGDAQFCGILSEQKVWNVHPATNGSRVDA